MAAVLKGKEQEKSKPFTLKSNSPVQQYLNIPLRTPAGYTPNDVSAGDLDGDGECINGNHIDKYKAGRIFTAEGCVSNFLLGTGMEKAPKPDITLVKIFLNH